MREVRTLSQGLCSAGELVAEGVQEREVHLIGAMRVRGVNLRLNIGAVVEQNVEDEVALMIVNTDVAGVDRNVVGGDRRIRHNPVLQPKVFGRMAGIVRAAAVSNFWPSLLECTTSPMS